LLFNMNGAKITL